MPICHSPTVLDFSNLVISDPTCPSPKPHFQTRVITSIPRPTSLDVFMGEDFPCGFCPLPLPSLSFHDQNLQKPFGNETSFGYVNVKPLDAEPANDAQTEDAEQTETTIILLSQETDESARLSNTQAEQAGQVETDIIHLAETAETGGVATLERIEKLATIAGFPHVHVEEKEATMFSSEKIVERGARLVYLQELAKMAMHAQLEMLERARWTGGFRSLEEIEMFEKLVRFEQFAKDAIPTINF